MTRFAVAALAAPLLLAGCHVQGKNPAHSDENVTINADESGHVAFNFPFAKGELKLPTSMMQKGDIDIDGVKLMPGSKMTGFNVDAGGDKGATVHMSFDAPAKPDEVRSYFLDQLKKKDLEAALAGDAVVGKSSEGTPFTIRVQPNGTGSQGTIEIHEKH